MKLGYKLTSNVDIHQIYFLVADKLERIATNRKLCRPISAHACRHGSDVPGVRQLTPREFLQHIQQDASVEQVRRQIVDVRRALGQDIVRPFREGLSENK